MHKLRLIVLVSGSILSSISAGLLFYWLYQNIFIVKSSFYYYNSARDQAATIKTVSLFLYKDKRWHEEKQQMAWFNAKQDQLASLVNSWLLLLDQEDMLEKKVSVQTVLLSASQQEAYISFDRNFLSKQYSIFDKLMSIESLLKTVRENNINIQKVHFLVHHKPMHDYHLDFSQAWPIIGFLVSSVS
jgi:hypothetical protein